MTDANQTTPPTKFETSGNVLTVERTFNAPRDLVWQAFTDPKHIEKWWGPRGWQTIVFKMDVRPGGVWHFVMRGPEGMESWGLATYREVSAPTRLTYDDAWSNPEGTANEDMPVTPVEIDFLEESGKTRIISVSRFDSVETLEQVKDMGLAEGLTETWDRLDEFVTGAQ